VFGGSPLLSHPKIPALDLSAEKSVHIDIAVPTFRRGEAIRQAAGKPATAHLRSSGGDSHTPGFIFQPEFGGDLQRVAGLLFVRCGAISPVGPMWACTVVPASPGAVTYRPNHAHRPSAYDWEFVLDKQFESAVFAGYLIDRGGGRWRKRRPVREYCWHRLRQDERPLTWCGLEVSDKDPRQPWSEVLESQACEKCCIARLEQ
jgi:hypothetical protein